MICEVENLVFLLVLGNLKGFGFFFCIYVKKNKVKLVIIMELLYVG